MRTYYSSTMMGLITDTQVLQLLLLVLTALRVVSEQAEDADMNQDDEIAATTEPLDLEWLEGFNGLGPFLIALFLLIFVGHTLVQPEWMTISLMQQYLNDGTPTTGTSLHCEERTNGSHLVEVSWQSPEHRHADNPSLKFRFPGAYEEKQFVRRFDYARRVEHGEAVPVLLPRGDIQPRSGCPREVVERILADMGTRQAKRWAIVIGGSVASVIVLVFAIKEILQMEEPHFGWIALLLSVGVFEAVSFLYTADQFMKKKRRTFDAARPMVNAAEQRERQERQAVDQAKTVAPFSIPLHEFAGHARATERKR